MAENAVWLSKYMDNKKIVLWAHNGHIVDNQQQEWRAMGNYLSNELDENYTTLGFLFSMGEVTAIESLGANSYGGLKAHKLDTKPKENSLNAIMSLTGEPAFFIEIGKLQNNIKWKEAFTEGIEFFQLGAVYNNQPEDYYSEFNPDWLDYLIYFDYSTATETFR
jgi:erythromycin esterase-like protein